MKKRAFIALTALLCASCATSNPTPAYKPYPSRPDMAALAAAFTGGKAAGYPPDPQNPHPKVDLRPTPTLAPILGERPVEVLRSAKESNYYVAWVDEVPITQFFEIIRPVSCNDWTFSDVIPRKYHRKFTVDIFADDAFTDFHPVNQCKKAIHERYIDKNPEVTDTDGTILNINTLKIVKKGVLNPYRKMQIDGVGVRFKEPTPDQLRKALSGNQTDPIKILQTRAAIYWIVEHRAIEYLPIMVELAKKLFNPEFPAYMSADVVDLIDAIAALDTKNEYDSLFLYMLEAGSGDDPRRRIVHQMLPISGKVQVAEFMGHKLACSNRPEHIKNLRKVASLSKYTNHSVAAIRALNTMGDDQYLVELYRTNENINEAKSLAYVGPNKHKRSFDTYKCPYKTVYEERNK